VDREERGSCRRARGAGIDGEKKKTRGAEPAVGLHPLYYIPGAHTIVPKVPRSLDMKGIGGARKKREKTTTILRIFLGFKSLYLNHKVKGVVRLSGKKSIEQTKEKHQPKKVPVAGRRKRGESPPGTNREQASISFISTRARPLDSNRIKRKKTI